MIKDITIGQYFPVNSFVHRIDPRVKILLTCLYITMVFFASNVLSFLICGVFLFVSVKASSVPFKNMVRGLKSVLFIIAFTGIFNLFMVPGDKLFSIGPLTATVQGGKMALMMIVRVFFLITGTTLLTFTTSPIRLTDGIEYILKPFSRFGVPAHELAMMMSIALRFIPTLIEETDKIMKAQSARGADFENGGIVKRAKSFVPILVPLFISAFRRADELAVAMECRCYRGGDGRTKLIQLKCSYVDLIAFLFVAVFLTLVIISRFI